MPERTSQSHNAYKVTMQPKRLPAWRGVNGGVSKSVTRTGRLVLHRFRALRGLTDCAVAGEGSMATPGGCDA